MDFGQRHLARALALDGFEDIAGLNAGLVGRTARNHRDDGGIAKAFRNRRSDFAFGLGLVGLVLFELGGGQIAGIRIQRLQQAVQRAVGDGGNVGFFHVLAAHPRQHFAVHLQLAVGAIVVGGANAVQSTHAMNSRTAAEEITIAALVFMDIGFNLLWKRNYSHERLPEYYIYI